MKNRVQIENLERKRKYKYDVSVMLLILAVLIIINMTLGSKNFSPTEVISVLFGKDVPGGTYIIGKLRFPRTIAAIICGYAFGIAGNTFQKLLGNPLASPDIIGVSTGSAAAAVFGILVLHANRGVVSIMAIVAGLVTVLVIYLIAYKDGYSTVRVILTGIGVQAFLSACISWMLLRAAEYDVPAAMRWMAGNLNEVTMDYLWLVGLVIGVVSCVIAVLSEVQKILELGEQHALILGVKVGTARVLLLACSVVMLAVATAVSGPISSIAFLSGPIAGGICGKNRSNTLASGIVGAILVIGADFIGQNLLPTRYPVGVVSGVLGAPYLLYLLIRLNKGDHV
ncbi:MAG: iron ABC transporter permease [Lachnospiraceae bacterium]|nr:iron ABC transporter permease [Lachnospiraceae bacterium]